MLRDAVLRFLDERGNESFTFRDLVRLLDIDADDRRPLKRVLDELIEQGTLRRIKKHLFARAQAGQRAIVGRLAAHRDGFGFVVPDDNSPDIYVRGADLAGAVHGDRVTVEVERGPERRVRSDRGPRGRIVRIVSRAHEQIVGKLIRHQGVFYLSPLDDRYHYTIRIAKFADHAQPEEGQVAIADIVAQPTSTQPPLGQVREILGWPDDPEVQFLIICHKHGISTRFPPDALSEADAARPPSGEDLLGREDFRAAAVVTIDGETARDFDDAVQVERRPDGGYRLGVHIADVAHYVAAASALDLEAFARGTSVYFPDRAVPMLPEKLSNNLCSLRPDEDRLTMSCILEIDHTGKVVASRFANSVIRSRARMTYTSVARILIDRDADERRRYEGLVPMFEQMWELAQLLNRRRQRAGAIDFDLPEAEVRFDDQGAVLDVVRSERNDAHRLIEEFMLAANEAVAEHLTEAGGPMIYRIHEDPDPFKVHEFAELIAKFGFTLSSRPDGSIEPRDFQRLALQLARRPEGRFLSYLMLRSFKRARYSENNEGHFGLASEFYTHFTSPIRRYPDLVVHRLLKAHLDGRPRDGRSRVVPMAEIALQSSERERRADEAEWEMTKLKMAEFMHARLGEEFDGFVSGFRHNGFHVELFDHFIEGYVHVATLRDDYYVFNEKAHCLVGENSGRTFQIGAKVRIRVDKVDRDRHLIDFAIVSNGERQPAKARRRVARAPKKARRR